MLKFNFPKQNKEMREFFWGDYLVMINEQK